MTEQIINGIPVVWEQDRVGAPGSYQMTPEERADFEASKKQNFENLQREMSAIERRATELMPFSRPTPPGGLTRPTQLGAMPNMADNAQRKFEARQRYDMLIARGTSPKEALGIAMQTMWQKPMTAAEQARISMQDRALKLREQPRPQAKIERVEYDGRKATKITNPNGTVSMQFDPPVASVKPPTMSTAATLLRAAENMRPSDPMRAMVMNQASNILAGAQSPAAPTQPQPTPQPAVSAPQISAQKKGAPTKDQAREFLRLANGDKQEARRLAKIAGFDF